MQTNQIKALRKARVPLDRSNKAKVSVIIPNYNGLSKLGILFLENVKSVVSMDYPHYEIIYIDNGSTDESFKQLLRRYRNAHLKLIKLEKNYGYTGGNNRGALYVSKDSKYLVFLNNDTIVDKNFIKELIKVMESDQRIAIAQPKIVNMDGSFQSAGAFYIPVTSSRLPKTADLHKVSLIFVAIGPALAIRRDVFNALGGFDEDFYLMAEEVDLCLRAVLRGYKIMYVPTSIVYHKHGATHKFNPIISFYDQRNLLWVAAKLFDATHITMYILFTFLHIIGSHLMTIKADHKSKMKAIARTKGFLNGLIHLKNALRKRVKLSESIKHLFKEFQRSSLSLLPLYLVPQSTLKKLISYRYDSIEAINKRFLSSLYVHEDSARSPSESD